MCVCVCMKLNKRTHNRLTTYYCNLVYICTHGMCWMYCAWPYHFAVNSAHIHLFRSFNQAFCVVVVVFSLYLFWLCVCTTELTKKKFTFMLMLLLLLLPLLLLWLYSSQSWYCCCFILHTNTLYELFVCCFFFSL